MIDLIISLGKSLEFYHEKYERVVITVAKNIGEKNKIIAEIKSNQQYIKTQVEGIHVKLKELEHIKSIKQNQKKIIDQHRDIVLQKIDKRAIELETQYKNITILLDNLKRLTLGEQV